MYKIQVAREKVCGSTRIVPQCKLSNLIADIVKKQCLAPSVVKKIKEHGVEIELVTYEEKLHTVRAKKDHSKPK